MLIDRWLYTRSETLDGNFQINKLKTKKPLDDVALADGKAFMVKEEEYREHIRITIDEKEVSCLRNYIAVDGQQFLHQEMHLS
jgi:hypothetical protein